LFKERCVTVGAVAELLLLRFRSVGFSIEHGFHAWRIDPSCTIDRLIERRPS
jgi:hypothetical protein